MKRREFIGTTTMAIAATLSPEVLAEDDVPEFKRVTLHEVVEVVGTLPQTQISGSGVRTTPGQPRCQSARSFAQPERCELRLLDEQRTERSDIETESPLSYLSWLSPPLPRTRQI